MSGGADALGRPAAQQLELTLGPIAHGGHTVARHEGRVVFVRHGIPGERVRVRVTEAEPTASFWRADVVEVLDASDDRRPHPWPEADALAAAAAGSLPVGGAEFGHIDPARQRELKRQVLAEQLTRLAGWTGAEDGDSAPRKSVPVDAVSVDAVPGEDPDGLHWRTRVTFDVDGHGRAGMHPHRSDAVVPVASMPLGVAAVDALGLPGVDLTGVSRVEVAVPSDGGRPLVTLFPVGAGIRGGTPGTGTGSVDTTVDAMVDPTIDATVAAMVEAAVERIADALPGAAVCRFDPVTRSVRAVAGQPWVTEVVGAAGTGGHRYRVTGDGFWQVHRAAPAVLTDALLGALGPVDGLTVHDLYAGAGLFSAALAGAGARVTSVEAAPGASEDARHNLAPSTGLDGPTVDVVNADVARFLGARPGRPRRGHAGRGRGRAAGRRQRDDDAAAKRAPADVVVVDPPRVGLDKRVVQQLVAAPPGRLAYISCDPASFARDLGRFRAAGWSLTCLRAFDLYPNTHHLESFALLVPPRDAR